MVEAGGTEVKKQSCGLIALGLPSFWFLLLFAVFFLFLFLGFLVVAVDGVEVARWME